MTALILSRRQTAADATFYRRKERVNSTVFSIVGVPYAPYTAPVLAAVLIFAGAPMALAHSPSRTVSITTAINQPLAPDRAVVTLSVQHAAPTANGAETLMGAAIDQLKAALTAEGFRQITVTTSNIRKHKNIKQERVYKPNGAYDTVEAEIHTLNATHELTVAVGKATAIDARDLLIDGVTQVNAINYQALPTDAALKAARKEALSQATQEARELAASLDMGLGLPTRINLSAGNNGRPISSKTSTLLTLPATANVVFSLETGDAVGKERGRRP